MAPTKTRQRSNSYVVDTYVAIPGQTKKKRVRTQGFATVEEVKAKKLELQGLAASGIDVTSKTTFAELAERVVAEKAKLRSGTTVNSYEQALVYALPHIGGMKLLQLKSSLFIDAVRDDMIAKGLAASTTNSYLSRISSIFSWATRKHIIPFNPCVEVDRVPKPRKRFFLPTDAQVNALIDAMEDESEVAGRPPFGLLTYLLSVTGFRINEALNLRWEDINTQAKTLYVAFGKTARAQRTITVGQDVIDELLTLRERQLIGGGYVFVTEDGARIKDWQVQGLFMKISKLLGFRAHAHLLRHYHASVFLALSPDIYKLQLRLGHEKITTTVDVYGHMIEGSDRSIAEAASAQIRRRAR